MSGSVGRLKAVVQIDGREVVNELRRNKFFQLSWRQGKAWRQDDSSSVRPGQDFVVVVF